MMAAVMAVMATSIMGSSTSKAFGLAYDLTTRPLRVHGGRGDIKGPSVPMSQGVNAKSNVIIKWRHDGSSIVLSA
jgi:hypothetical protein